MKLPPILTGIILDPIAGTLDFSALDIGFDPRTVLGVLHEPTNRFIFAKGRPGLGYTAIVGSVMTLAADTSDLVTGPLTGFRDDGALIATDARLEACRALLATGNATLSNLYTGLGTPSDTDPGSDSAPGSLIAKVTRLLGTQTGIATVLAAIRDRLPAALVGGRLSVDGSGVTQPISAAALPLPAGAATAGKQDAGNTVLANILTALAPLATDAGLQSVFAKLEAVRALLAGTLTATLAAGSNTIGAVTQAGTWAVNATLQAGTAVVGRVGLQVGGADVAAGNPIPVSVGNFPATQAISAAALPLAAGAATSTKQDTGNASLSSLDGKLPAKGQAAMAASTPVAIAADQSRLPADTIVQAASVSRSGTITTGGTAQPLMAANAGRRGFVLQNQSSGDLYVNSIGTATLDQNSLKIPAGSYYETPTHHVGTGAVSIIGATAGQAFYAREF